LKDLLVIIPTRGRRSQCERLLESFTETAKGPGTELIFIIDPDDDAYEDMDWGGAMAAQLDPRGSLTAKLNKTAMTYADEYRALMYVGDDHVFRTPGWDKMIGDALVTSHMVYPDDRRRSDVPEIIAITSALVKALGHFAEPSLAHYYIDNAWSELGRRACVLRYLPEVVIEHLHYSLDASVEHDRTYREAETRWGEPDLKAFNKWRATIMPAQVSVLRRNFNPDIAWVLSKV
jgi:hypothetical protein